MIGGLLPAVRPVPPPYTVRVTPLEWRRTPRRVQGGATRERSRAARRTSGMVADGKSVWSWHPLLVSSRRRRVGPTGRGHVVNSPATVARRIRRRGELAISRKTIAWGTPDVSGASAVNTRVHTSLPQRTRGCGCIGHPAFPAPSVHDGDESSGNPRAHPPRDRGCVSHEVACHTRMSFRDARSVGPESITTTVNEDEWIPGSPLRGAPA